ncbi:MAG: hypothetical protein ACRDJ4_01905 [Actinomycetota bacterium]
MGAGGGETRRARNVGADQWAEVRDAWIAYRGAVGAWLETARDPETDPGLIDVLTEMVVGLHGRWTSMLRDVVEATRRR